ncbi:MAG TPA: hypothetical protein VF212_06995 [Longimicrobiales bacterium]
MKRCNRLTRMLAFALGAALHAGTLAAQTPPASLGTISTRGDLILLELDPDAVPAANLFDLEGRTLRFTPDGAGYRATVRPLEWDPEFGDRLQGSRVALRDFSFPMSGRDWDAFFVNPHGTISFGAEDAAFPIGRFAELRESGDDLVNTVPVISVFLKPRMSGARYVKQLADRVVVTWTLTEPAGGVFDFTWTPTVNRFQAVLHRDGTIELSYDELAAQDAIVGVYPLPGSGARAPLFTLSDAEDPFVPGALDVREVRASVLDGAGVEITLETRTPVLPEGHPRLPGTAYRVHFDLDAPFAADDTADVDLVWTIRGEAGRGSTSVYETAGRGLSSSVRVDGNAITVFGAGSAFEGADSVAAFVEVVSLGYPHPIYDRVAPTVAALPPLRDPEVDLSAVTAEHGAVGIRYEVFHHVGRPDTEAMACTVIRALGDHFDFLVYVSDFRVDNQEAGTPSTGAIGSSVRGYGRDRGRAPGRYCSDGRLQATYIQPVPISANQAMREPPHDTLLARPGDATSRKPGAGPYDLALTQMSHELGHRWAAFASAIVGNDTIRLGPTHWRLGLHAPAAFPYRRPVEASTMGGAVWQDNGDGTYTLLADNFFVPASGYSHLDLYLMGLLPPADVPDFFVLTNLARVGTDAQGRPVYTGDKVTITIEDFIAMNGQRWPPFEKSQKRFNTGFVGLVLNGQEPSAELIERMNGIRETWIDYWSKVTGGVSTMTASVDRADVSIRTRR